MRGILFLILSLLFLRTVFAESAVRKKQEDLVLREARVRHDCARRESFLYLCGLESERSALENLINTIQKTPYGFYTWWRIATSGHNLMIQHSVESVSSAGRAVASLTTALSDGRGGSVIIYFHSGIPDTGSHRVGGTLEEWTAFTKQQNFYHELSHARHKMSGTWDPIHSEEQAIQDENVYRTQLEPRNHNLRSLDWNKGEQIWTPSRVQ